MIPTLGIRADSAENSGVDAGNRDFDLGNGESIRSCNGADDAPEVGVELSARHSRDGRKRHDEQARRRTRTKCPTYTIP